MSTVRDLLEAIYQDRGALTPALVVEEATPVGAPLHPFFEWDDTKAAHEHRLSQARHLIRSVRVQVEAAGVEAGPVAVRVFHSVPSRGVEQYVPTRSLTITEQDEVEAQAMADWRAFKRKYEGLAGVFATIRQELAA